MAAETLTKAGSAWTIPPDMSNVLGDDEKQQVIALGRLGETDDETWVVTNAGA